MTVLAWHAEWVLTRVVGPMEAFDMSAVGIAMPTFAATLLGLKDGALRVGELFLRVPARLVSAALAVSAVIGISTMLLAYHKASGFYPASERGPDCWGIFKKHGAIHRCVSYEQWLHVSRLDQLSNVAFLSLMVTVCVSFLAIMVWQANDDEVTVSAG